MSHFPGKNLSGILVAYVTALAVYKKDIKIIHSTAT